MSDDFVVVVVGGGEKDVSKQCYETVRLIYINIINGAIIIYK